MSNLALCGSQLGGTGLLKGGERSLRLGQLFARAGNLDGAFAGQRFEGYSRLGNLGLSDKDEAALVEFMKTLSDGWTP